jgi:hypothetical protein
MAHGDGGSFSTFQSPAGIVAEEIQLADVCEDRNALVTHTDALQGLQADDTDLGSITLCHALVPPPGLIRQRGQGRRSPRHSSAPARSEYPPSFGVFE